MLTGRFPTGGDAGIVLARQLAGHVGALAASLCPMLGAHEKSLPSGRAGGGSVWFHRLLAYMLGVWLCHDGGPATHRKTMDKTLGDEETPGLGRLQPLLSMGRKLALVLRSLFSEAGTD